MEKSPFLNRATRESCLICRQESGWTVQILTLAREKVPLDGLLALPFDSQASSNEVSLTKA